MNHTKDFGTFLKKMQETLPQSAQIREEDAHAWWKAVKLDKFNSEEWHLERLRKIGGSESGILVAPIVGDPAPFDQTPAELYDRKLMREEMIQNIAMKFGHEHEDIARQAYEAHLKEKGWVRDNEGLEILKAFMKKDQGSMAYSPDDLFIHTDTGQRLLPDYKCPYSGKIPGLRGEPKEPKPSYIAQLHHGKEVCRRAGLTVDKMVLCVMDHPDNLARPKERRLIVLQIEENPDLTKIIIEQCDLMMDRVLSGRRPLPSYISPEKQERAEMALFWMKDIEKQLIEASIQEKIANAKVKTLRDAISTVSQDLFLSPAGRMNNAELGLHITPRISLSLVEGQEQAALSVAPEMPVKKSLDIQAVEDFLKMHGKSLDDFQKEGEPDISEIADDDDCRAALISRGIVQAGVSFAVSSKLKPENLPEYNDYRPDIAALKSMPIQEAVAFLTTPDEPSSESEESSSEQEESIEDMMDNSEEERLYQELENEPMI